VLMLVSGKLAYRAGGISPKRLAASLLRNIR